MSKHHIFLKSKHNTLRETLILQDRSSVTGYIFSEFARPAEKLEAGTSRPFYEIW